MRYPPMNSRRVSMCFLGGIFMVSLLEGGAYLVNGTEIIPDSAEALSAVAAKTGKTITK